MFITASHWFQSSSLYIQSSVFLIEKSLNELVLCGINSLHNQDVSVWLLTFWTDALLHFCQQPTPFISLPLHLLSLFHSIYISLFHPLLHKVHLNFCFPPLVLLCPLSYYKFPSLHYYLLSLRTSHSFVALFFNYYAVLVFILCSATLLVVSLLHFISPFLSYFFLLFTIRLV